MLYLHPTATPPNKPLQLTTLTPGRGAPHVASLRSAMRLESWASTG